MENLPRKRISVSGLTYNTQMVYIFTRLFSVYEKFVLNLNHAGVILFFFFMLSIFVKSFIFNVFFIFFILFYFFICIKKYWCWINQYCCYFVDALLCILIWFCGCYCWIVGANVVFRFWCYCVAADVRFLEMDAVLQELVRFYGSCMVLWALAWFWGCGFVIVNINNRRREYEVHLEKEEN